MVLREFLDSVDLVRAQTLYIYKLTEVVVVSEDKDLIFAVFQVVVLSLKSFNNYQELLIMGFVPSHNKDHLLRKNGYWVPLANFRFEEIKI